MNGPLKLGIAVACGFVLLALAYSIGPVSGCHVNPAWRWECCCARESPPGMLTVIHLVGIPLDGTSVNPARSIGPALFNGGESLSQLWVFILFPLIGGAVAAFVAPLFETAIPKGDVDPTGATVPEA